MDAGITRRLRTNRFYNEFVNASNEAEAELMKHEFEQDRQDAIAAGRTPKQCFPMWPERHRKLMQLAPAFMAELIDRHQRAMRGAGWPADPKAVLEMTSGFVSSASKPLDDVLPVWYARCSCQPDPTIIQPKSTDLRNAYGPCPHVISLAHLKTRLKAHEVADKRSKFDVIKGARKRGEGELSLLIQALEATTCVPVAPELSVEVSNRALRFGQADGTTDDANAQQPPPVPRHKPSTSSANGTSEPTLRLVVHTERYGRTGQQRNVLCGLVVRNPNEHEQAHARKGLLVATGQDNREARKVQRRQFADIGEDEPPDDPEAEAAAAAAEEAEAVEAVEAVEAAAQAEAQAATAQA